MLLRLSVAGCPLSIVGCQPFLKFSSETNWIIKAKLCVEPPWEGGTKVCINGPGHMTKMATTPIYVNFSRTRSLMNLKLGMDHQGLKFCNVYINDDHGLTMIYLTARLNMIKLLNALMPDLEVW